MYKFSELNKIIIIIKKLKILLSLLLLLLLLILLLLNTTNLKALNLQKLTDFTVFSFKSRSTHTAVSFVCKTGLTGCVVLAKVIHTFVLGQKNSRLSFIGNWNSCFTSNCFTENHESQIAYNCKLRLLRWSSLHLFLHPSVQIHVYEIGKFFIIFNNLFPFP